MTSRAALLPTPGDPFIIAAWLNLYKKVWAGEVSKLYIHLNSRLEKPVMDYVRTLCEDSAADVTYTCAWMGHGEALKVILEKSTEEHIFLVEDDAYISKPGIVNAAFSLVERKQTDCVVTTRGSCSESLRIREAEHWGLQGDFWYKPNFWPCFFFANRHILDDCPNLATYNVAAGTLIPQLQWVTPENISMDTFGEASLQLRSKGLRFYCVHDGRATTQDLFLSPQREGIFANPPVAPWVHFGSTSSGISNSLLDEKHIPLESRDINQAPTRFPTITDDHLKDDYERRISLWQLCRDYFPIPSDSPAVYFNQVYSDAINRLVDGCALNRERLGTYIEIYRNLLSSMWSK